MLEKIQEKLYQKIENELLNQINVEIPFKYFLTNWFPKQNVPDKDFTRTLLNFDKKYGLDHIITLNNGVPMSIRFWLKKRSLVEDKNA